MEKAALLTAGSVFLLVAVLHLVRFFLRLEVRVGNFVMPVWTSALGFLVALSLSMWMLALAR